jgi:hypothetical protein
MTPMPPLPLASATSPEGSSAPPTRLTKKKFSKEEAGRSFPPNDVKTAQGQVPVVKIKKGCRFKIVRRNVYHIASAGQRKKIPYDAENSYNIYGTVVTGSSGRRGWDAQFDIFPLDNHTIKSIDRKKLITVPSLGAYIMGI